VLHRDDPWGLANHQRVLSVARLAPNLSVRMERHKPWRSAAHVHLLGMVSSKEKEMNERKAGPAAQNCARSVVALGRGLRSAACCIQ
jgi:hypothetical protein